MRIDSQRLSATQAEFKPFHKSPPLHSIKRLWDKFLVGQVSPDPLHYLLDVIESFVFSHLGLKPNRGRSSNTSWTASFVACVSGFGGVIVDSLCLTVTEREL